MKLILKKATKNLYFLSSLLFVSMLFWWPLSLLSFIIALVCANLREEEGWPEARSPWIWRVVVFLLFVPPIFIGENEIFLFSILPFSLEIYHQVGLMFSRAITIYIALILITDRLSPQSLGNTASRLFGKSVGISLVLALNLLPLIRYSVIQTYSIMQLRGGFRKYKIRNLWLFFSSVLMQSLILAELTTDATIIHHRLTDSTLLNNKSIFS